MGLLHPQSGELRLGNTVINKDNAYLLQSKVGYVPQAIFLSDNTIRSNIAFGLDDEDIDEEKIQDAVSQSQLRDLMHQLPEGLDTMVGEKGVQLSGGQRQRIAIARSLILNPSFMILDEPTSALDRSIQMQIIELLKNIQTDFKLTYLFISHDLKVVQSMSDYIFVMQNGYIVESGPAKQVFSNPEEVYTDKLLNAALRYSTV